MRTLIVLVIILCLMFGVPVLGSPPHPEATFRTERVYVRCAFQDARVDNLSTASNTWDTNPPSGSFLDDRAGCGTVIGPNQDPPFVGEVGYFRARGNFVGNLRDLTVQLHDLGHVAAQPQHAPTFPLLITLRIDGETVVDGARITPAAVAENSGVTDRITFSVARLAFDDEPGDGMRARSLELYLVPDPGAVLVYDATEVPAGITFNPESLAVVVIERS